MGMESNKVLDAVENSTGSDDNNGNSPSTDEAPTIVKAIERHGRAFLEAGAGNDITGNVTGTLLEFLKTKDLPPYYHVKSYIILAAAREDEDYQVVAIKHFIGRAEVALKKARETYVHDPKDKELLDKLEDAIDDERKELKREFGAQGDDDDEDDDEDDDDDDDEDEF